MPPNPVPTIVTPVTKVPPVPTAGAAGRSAFVPVLLLAVALLAFVGLQATQSVMARGQLAQAQANLEPQVQQATKVRASLEALAVATAKLGAQGNANAQNIVDQLRRRGVTIDAAKP
jgi:hypothetical protein